MACSRKHIVQIKGRKSGWGYVSGCIPQGYVLSLLLFIIYINDSDTGINSDIKKFVIDTKIDRVIESDQGTIILQFIWLGGEVANEVVTQFAVFQLSSQELPSVGQPDSYRLLILCLYVLFHTWHNIS